MHLFKALLTGAALVASTVAQAPGQIAFTSFPSDVQVGNPVTLEWTGGEENAPVTITLRRGPRGDLQDVAVLTSSATGGSYTWTPSEDLVEGANYALQISQGGVVNYTGQFAISGGSEDSSSSTVPSSTTVTLSSATSSTVSPTSSETTMTSSSSSVPSTTSETESSATTTDEPTTSSTMVTTTGSGETEPTQTPAPDPLDGAAASVKLSSPLALIVGALGAFAYLN